AVRLLDESGDDLPVGFAVDADPDPALVPDVWRTEEMQWVLLDERFLHARSRGKPDGLVLGAVMVRIHLREHLAGAPRGLSPGDLLGDLRKGEADGAQAFERRALGRALGQLPRMARFRRRLPLRGRGRSLASGHRDTSYTT